MRFTPGLAMCFTPGVHVQEPYNSHLTPGAHVQELPIAAFLDHIWTGQLPAAAGRVYGGWASDYSASSHSPPLSSAFSSIYSLQVLSLSRTLIHPSASFSSIYRRHLSQPHTAATRVPLLHLLPPFLSRSRSQGQYYNSSNPCPLSSFAGGTSL